MDPALLLESAVTKACRMSRWVDWNVLRWNPIAFWKSTTFQAHARSGAWSHICARVRSLPKWRNHHFCLGKHQSAQHKTRSKLETKHHLTSRKDMEVLLLDAWCFLVFSVQVLLRRISLLRHQTQVHADCRFYCMLHIWEKRDELAQRDERFVHVCALSKVISIQALACQFGLKLPR